jgi:hypothetical protein
MGNRSLVPRPWWQVGLAVLPGLLVLLGPLLPSPSPLSTTFRLLVLAVMILLMASSLYWAIRGKSLFRIPVWGLIPFGFLVGIGLFFLAAPLSSGPFLPIGSLWFLLACLLLLVIGLVFARANGLGAGLFVLAGGMMIASFEIEASAFLGDGPLGRLLLGPGGIALLLLISPLLVLCTRSLLIQAVGLLLPLAAYAAAFIYALYHESRVPLAQPAAVGIPYVVLFATMVIAVAVYGWVSSRATARGGERWGLS